MKIIKLSNTDGHFSVSDEDFYRVRTYSWGFYKHPRGSSIRARLWDKEEKKYKGWILSRFILDVRDPNIQVDHKNNDRLDNTRENLRLCTPQENCRNRPKYRGTSSKYKGVYRRAANGKYCAQISDGKRRINLGDFASEVEAARAYDAAAIRLHGEFARCNMQK